MGGNAINRQTITVILTKSFRDLRNGRLLDVSKSRPNPAQHSRTGVCSWHTAASMMTMKGLRVPHFGPGTDPRSLLKMLFINSWRFHQIRLGLNLSWMFFRQVNSHQLTGSDFWHNVIRSRWQPRQLFHAEKCCHLVSPHTQRTPGAVCCSSVQSTGCPLLAILSIVSEILIHNIFVYLLIMPTMSNKRLQLELIRDTVLWNYPTGMEWHSQTGLCRRNRRQFIGKSNNKRD